MPINNQYYNNPPNLGPPGPRNAPWDNGQGNSGFDGFGEMNTGSPYDSFAASIIPPDAPLSATDFSPTPGADAKEIISQLSDWTAQQLKQSNVQGTVTGDTLKGDSSETTLFELDQARQTLSGMAQSLLSYSAGLEPESDVAVAVQANISALSTLDATLDVKTQSTNRIIHLEDVESQKQSQFMEFANLHKNSPGIADLAKQEIQRRGIVKNQLTLFRQAAQDLDHYPSLEPDSPEAKALLEKIKQQSSQYDDLEQQRFDTESSLNHGMQQTDAYYRGQYPGQPIKNTLLNHLEHLNLVSRGDSLSLQSTFLNQARTALGNKSQTLRNQQYQQGYNSPDTTAIPGQLDALQSLDQALASQANRIQSETYNNTSQIQRNLDIDQFVEAHQADPEIQHLVDLETQYRTPQNALISLGNVTGALNTISANLDPNGPTNASIQKRIQAVNSLTDQIEAKSSYTDSQINQVRQDIQRRGY